MTNPRSKSRDRGRPGGARPTDVAQQYATADHPRNQSAPVLLRLEPRHLHLINEAAEHLGLARASWMRSALLQAAREVIREKGAA